MSGGENEGRLGAALVMPAIILLGIVLLIPQLHALFLSLFERGEFVGLKHYRALAANSDTVVAIWNTLIFTVGAVVVSILIGFGIAVLLDRRTRAQRIVRSIAIAPFVITPIVGAFAWKMMLNPTYGVLNYYLTFLGIPMGSLEWLSDPDLALAVVVLAYVWVYTPFVTLIILAGMQNLPQSPFEAAEVDGANNWMILRRVLLPLIAPSLYVAAIFQCVFALREFAVIWVMTQGGPLNATYVLSMDIYRKLFLYGRDGYSSAVGVLMLAMTFALTLPLVYRVVRTSSSR